MKNNTPSVRRSTKPRKWLWIGLLLTGCSDPATSRLAPGTAVILMQPEDQNVQVWEPKRGPVFVPQATAAVVVKDEASLEFPDTPLRVVKVVIKEGVEEGLTADVERKKIKIR